LRVVFSIDGMGSKTQFRHFVVWKSTLCLLAKFWIEFRHFSDMWQHWHVGQEIGCGLGFYWKHMQSNHGLYIARVVLFSAPRTKMDQVSSTVFLVDLGNSINSVLFGHVGHGKCGEFTYYIQVLSIVLIFVLMVDSMVVLLP
jgi:hypothetical protein